MISIQEIEKVHGHKPRFASLSLSQIESVVSMIPAFGKEVGIKNFDPLILKTTGAWLKEHFGWISAPELKHAFECYAAGKLPLCEKHYGEFNKFWMGSLLTEYKSECESARHLSKTHPKQIDPSHLLGHDGRDAERKEADEWAEMLKWIIKDEMIPEYGNWDLCYNHLERSGRIKLSDQEKKDFAAVVMGIINREADELKGEHVRKDFRKQFLNGSQSFKTKCKWEYMKKWIADQVMDTDGTLVQWASGELEKLNQSVS